MAFVLPSKSEVGVLAPDIAGEGEHVILSDGDQINWTPPPAKPIIPDWSGIKSIRKYFGRTGYQVWPAWFYHPTEAPRLLKNADEGAELGVCRREATFEEQSKYNLKAVWDWKDDCKWRPSPWAGTLKFDPQKPGAGKTYMPSAPNPVNAQNELVRALIPEVAAAVAQALRSNGPSAPPTIDPKQWDAFLQFQAWQKTAEAMGAIEQEAEAPAAPATNALNALSPDEEYTLWKEEAERKGIKVDGRWSLERVKAEVEKAA